MCLCGILTVTDYDCWHDEEDDVSVTSVVEVLKKNNINVANVLKKLVPAVNYRRSCECKNALQNAIITSPDIIKKGNRDITRVLLKGRVK